jgi:hypothetical protein
VISDRIKYLKRLTLEVVSAGDDYNFKPAGFGCVQLADAEIPPADLVRKEVFAKTMDLKANDTLGVQ